MRILITNDDGIESPVLPDLVRFARRLGEVTVIAPKVEQSGMSHAIEFKLPIEIKRVTLSDELSDVPTYAMDSTPADCVRFGVLGLNEKFDLILSGINRGYNLGADIVYSGTVGAVFEGARLSIPGIALSADPIHYTESTEHLELLLRYFKDKELLSRTGWYNVNIPPVVQGIRPTKQGEIYFTDRYKKLADELYIADGELLDHKSHDLSIDIEAVVGGYISVTPLSRTRTEMTVFESLRQER